MEGNIVGDEIFELEPGTMIKVMSFDENVVDNESVIGMTLLRVNSLLQPLVEVATGQFWGDRMTGYTFREVQNIKRK